MKVIVNSVVMLLLLTTIALTPAHTSAANTAGAQCTAIANSLSEARQAYSQQCDVLRVDCDPVGNGWMCSSHVIGDNSPSRSATPQPSKQDSTMVLNLLGSGNMYTDSVPDAEIPGKYVDAWCFDLDLIDMRSGRHLGQATDCLDNSRQEYSLSDSGIAMVGTTYFNFPDGMLAIQGRTTVQPRNWPTREFTHITGGNSAGNAVLYGTGKYENAYGTARLSGMVDLSQFRGQVGDPISFDCIFVVDVSY